MRDLLTRDLFERKVLKPVIRPHGSDFAVVNTNFPVAILATFPKYSDALTFCARINAAEAHANP
jgi:hypothetical protein